MRIAPLADVKARLSAYLDRCEAEGPIVITRNGKAVAVLLVPYDDDDLERLLLGRSPRFQALLNRSRQSIEEGKGLSEDRDKILADIASAKQKALQLASDGQPTVDWKYLLTPLQSEFDAAVDPQSGLLVIVVARDAGGVYVLSRSADGKWTRPSLLVAKLSGANSVTGPVCPMASRSTDFLALRNP